MTRKEFEEKRNLWFKEWNEKWRVLDIDFETYMIMNGMTQAEYKKLNENTITINRDYIDDWINKLELIQKKEPSSYNSYFEGQLKVLREIQNL
jgi:hypothetical protein